LGPYLLQFWESPEILQKSFITLSLTRAMHFALESSSKFLQAAVQNEDSTTGRPVLSFGPTFGHRYLAKKTKYGRLSVVLAAFWSKFFGKT